MADTPQSPLSPNALAQIDELLKLSGDRARRTEPIHEAAMAMASRLAPGYARSAMNGGTGPGVSGGGSRPVGGDTRDALTDDLGGSNAATDIFGGGLPGFPDGRAAAGGRINGKIGWPVAMALASLLTGGTGAAAVALAKKLMEKFGGSAPPPLEHPDPGNPDIPGFMNPNADPSLFLGGFPDSISSTRDPRGSVTTSVDFPGFPGGSSKPGVAGRWPDEEFWERNG